MGARVRTQCSQDWTGTRLDGRNLPGVLLPPTDSLPDDETRRMAGSDEKMSISPTQRPPSEGLYAKARGGGHHAA